jgi:hypothetical protein
MNSKLTQSLIAGLVAALSALTVAANSGGLSLSEMAQALVAFLVGAGLVRLVNNTPVPVEPTPAIAGELTRLHQEISKQNTMLTAAMSGLRQSEATVQNLREDPEGR